MEMEQFPKKLKLWLLAVWDKIADFVLEQWEDRRAVCIAVAGCLLLAIALLIAIPATQHSIDKKNAPQESNRINEVELEPFLAVPLEPAIEDDYVYTRKDITRWSEESVDKWFSEPDEEMLWELKDANDRLVDDMMEVVP